VKPQARGVTTGVVTLLAPQKPGQPRPRSRRLDHRPPALPGSRRVSTADRRPAKISPSSWPLADLSDNLNRTRVTWPRASRTAPAIKNPAEPLPIRLACLGLDFAPAQRDPFFGYGASAARSRRTLTDLTNVASKATTDIAIGPASKTGGAFAERRATPEECTGRSCNDRQC
jgi:hypothetical protein